MIERHKLRGPRTADELLDVVGAYLSEGAREALREGFVPGDIGDIDIVRAVVGEHMCEVRVPPDTPRLHEEFIENDRSRCLRIVDDDGKVYQVSRWVL